MDGTALVMCDGHFDKPTGKTAHGLVRGTMRYKVLGVIDANLQGKDAGEVLDGKPAGIPIYGDLDAAIDAIGGKPDYLVMGVAPDGGRMPAELRPAFLQALRAGINVDCGLHQQLGQDPEMSEAAAASGAAIRDVRRCKPFEELHFFEGIIDEVKSVRIAVLGTDSAVGKRTTARLLADSLSGRGVPSVMVGTGQTAWFQGHRYSMLLDATINDFVAGEIEHAVYSAWKEENPRFIFIEGQGCMTNPAFPGGFEILGAARPDAVILQHAPKRKYYDGFPGFEVAGIERERKIIELMGDFPVIAVTINHEDMTPEEVDATVAEYEKEYGIPATDVLLHGADKIIDELKKRFPAAFEG